MSNRVEDTIAVVDATPNTIFTGPVVLGELKGASTEHFSPSATKRAVERAATKETPILKLEKGADDLLKANVDEAALDAALLDGAAANGPGAANNAVPQVLRNQAAGNAARDFIAASRPGSLIEQNFRVTGDLAVKMRT